MAMRPKALAGLRRAWVLEVWPTVSPLVAFFWSSKVRDAYVRRSKRFKSFKGAEEACRIFEPWWRWMLSRRKGVERLPGSPPWQYSPGRSSQK